MGGRPPRGGGRPPARKPGISPAFIIAALAVLILLVILLVLLIPRITESENAPAVSSSTQTEQAAESSSTASASESSSTAAEPEGVESPWTESGYFSTGNEQLDNKIKQLCDEYTTPGANYAENAHNANMAVVVSDYIERANNQSPWGETWDVEYALQWFDENNSGNCYNFAAMTEYILKYFGYEDAEAEPCVVHLQSGNWGDHGLVFVTNRENNEWSLVDDALGADGWMLEGDVYEFDVRNIAQNSTVKGNVSVLHNDEPSPIPPGELTE